MKKILSQKINIFLNAIKVTILIAYLFNAVAFSFSRTYSLGYTKGMVLLPIVNTKLDPYLKQASLINEENNKINAYVDLFTSVEIRNDMHELLEELNTYEELFISEIYPIISLSGEVNTIPKLYQETYGKEFLDHGEGVLALLLIDDQVLFDVVFRDIEDKDISLSKVPIYDNYKYTSYNKKLIELYKYVKNNQSLILWLSIEDDDNDLIQNFMENYKSIHKGTDKRHQKQLERLYLSSKQYYMMRNYVLDIMASESLLDEIEVNEYALSDEIIIEYLKDKDHFDTLIKKFNKDYKNKKFEIVDNRHRLQFKTAYQLSNDYLDEYRTYSLSLNEQVHPKTRLIASYVNSHQGSKDFFNHTLAFDILLDSSNKNNDNIYNLTDYVILHYLNEEHKIKVDENKLSQLLEKIDQLVRVDTSSGTQSLLYENRLGEKKSYIETYYTAGYITYEGMLTLNRYDEYFDSTEIQNLMK